MVKESVANEAVVDALRVGLQKQDIKSLLGDLLEPTEPMLLPKRMARRWLLK